MRNTHREYYRTPHQSKYKPADPTRPKPSLLLTAHPGPQGIQAAKRSKKLAERYVTRRELREYKIYELRKKGLLSSQQGKRNIKTGGQDESQPVVEAVGPA